MCEKYDRTHCVAELGVRGDIIKQINDGWKPCNEYEAPTKGGKTDVDAESSCSKTSIVSTQSRLKPEEDISKLYE